MNATMDNASATTSTRPGAGQRMAQTLRELMARPSGAIGLTLVVLHVLIALASPWLATHDFKAVSAIDMPGSTVIAKPRR